MMVSPDFELSTEQSRQALPRRFDLARTVGFAGNLAGFVHALDTGDRDLLRRCLRDPLAEPHRAALVPGFRAAQAAAMAAGAWGCTLSGSGPAIFAVAESPAHGREVADALQGGLRGAGLDSTAGSAASTSRAPGCSEPHETDQHPRRRHDRHLPRGGPGGDRPGRRPLAPRSPPPLRRLAGAAGSGLGPALRGGDGPPAGRRARPRAGRPRRARGPRLPGAAGGGPPRRLRPRAVPRADPGLQGLRRPLLRRRARPGARSRPSGHHPHRHQRRHRRGGRPGVLEAGGGAGGGALPARPGLGAPGAAIRDPGRERHRPLRRRRLRRLPGAGEGRLRGRRALGPPRPHLGELDQRRAPAAADPLLRRGGGAAPPTRHLSRSRFRR